MKLLHIDSSILGANSVSRRLSASLVRKWRAEVPGLEVVYRDLAVEPLPHLSGALLGAQAAAPETRSPEDHRDVTTSAAVLEEFLAADIVVVGAPMYNFTISSQLKAWIDRIAVAGKTFHYTANGPEGLAGDKKVVVVSTRGGFYGSDTPLAAIDHQEPYLRAVFGFFGITNLEYIRAEGIAVSPEQREKAVQDAERQIAGQQLAASAAA